MRAKIWLSAAGLAALLTGCAVGGSSSEWAADQSGICVTKEGAVKSALVYTSEQPNELYDQDGLAEFVSQAVADYIAEYGETTVDGVPKPPVSLESCRLEGNTGTLVFSYASPEDFVKFSGATGDDTNTVTALSTGNAAGLAPDASYISPSGKALSYEDILKKRNAAAVRIDGACSVFTEGKILGVTDGTVIMDEHHAQTPEGEESCIIFSSSSGLSEWLPF